MMKLQHKEIDEMLGEMVEQNVVFTQLERTDGMFCIGIGEEVDGVIAKKVSLLQILCPWRIKNNKGRVVVSSYDMYVPNSETEWSDDFRVGGVQINNLLEEKIKNWADGSKKVVVGYELRKDFDLLVKFDDGSCLEVFVNTTSDVQCWYLHAYRCKKSLFVSGCDIYIGKDKVYEREESL